MAPASRALLVAVSGIDGSGKGFVAERIVAGLGDARLRAVAINVDAWLEPPARRFDAERPGEHFYRNALRLAEMFDRLVLPLARERSVRVEFDAAEETASELAPRTLTYDGVDVVVVEGVFLLRRDLCAHYDLAFWVECSFETALTRALRRGQEGLPFDETIRAYQTIYFPAQFVHFALDDPRAAADALIFNDTAF